MKVTLHVHISYEKRVINSKINLKTNERSINAVSLNLILPSIPFLYFLSNYWGFVDEPLGCGYSWLAIYYMCRWYSGSRGRWTTIGPGKGLDQLHSPRFCWTYWCSLKFPRHLSCKDPYYLYSFGQIAAESMSVHLATSVKFQFHVFFLVYHSSQFMQY